MGVPVMSMIDCSAILMVVVEVQAFKFDAVVAAKDRPKGSRLSRAIDAI